MAVESEIFCFSRSPAGRVWNCGDCHLIHLRYGEVTLDLPPEVLTAGLKRRRDHGTQECPDCGRVHLRLLNATLNLTVSAFHGLEQALRLIRRPVNGRVRIPAKWKTKEMSMN